MITSARLTGRPPVPDGTLGSPRLHLRRTDSTNLRARALAGAGAVHGTLVTAAEQTAGRGRQGRGWAAPAGTALLMSLILRDPPSLVTLRAGVAVADAVAALDPSAREVALKWPNDVWLDGRKVAGILVEGRPGEGWAVLGIGLNVAVELSRLPGEVRERAASLGLGRSQLEPALEVVLGDLSAVLSAPEEIVLERLRRRDALRGRPVAWDGGAGVGAGIDGHGRLRVASPSGTVKLDAGEVHLRPAPPPK